MDALLQDLRYAFRTLRGNPGFALAAILTLGLGIGANSAIFSVVNAVLFRSLPFTDAERIVSLDTRNEARGIDEGGITFADLERWKAGSGSLEDVAGLDSRSFTLMDGEISERVQGSVVTSNLFPLLGVQPQLGRGFRPDDQQPAGFEQAVLLSDGLWRRRYGADPNLVGQAIRLNDRELVVVGVMPPGFRFPETDEIWLPVGVEPGNEMARRFLWGVGKLRPGATVEAAQRELTEIGGRMAAESPATHRGWEPRVLPFRDAFIGPADQRLLYLMLGAVGFVLLIACANVANLLLARASDREKEITIRAAVGGGRGRIVRQLLTESLLVALAGGALGVLIAVWWVDATVRVIPQEMAYWIRFEIDGRVLLYTLLLSLATGLLFGLLPALRASRADLTGGLKEGSRGTGGWRKSRLRSALIAGEVAMSLVLLVGAALMVQSFLRLQAADAGFSPERMLTMRITLSGDQYDPVAGKVAFFDRVVERVGSLPGVAGVAVTTSIPADDGGSSVDVVAEGSGILPDEAAGAIAVASAAGFWSGLGVPLLAGRDFTAQEATDSAGTAVILGRTLAARLWADGGAVGRRIRLGTGEDAVAYTVVGVAPDLQYEEFGEETDRSRLQLHLPYARIPTRQMAILVRGSGDAAGLARSVNAEIRRVDPLLATYEVMTMAERRSLSTWEQQVFGGTFGAFGVIALALSLVGVYGVTAYGVSQRRREIGVRVALGAQSRDVLRLVVGQGTGLALVGVGLGLVGALAITRLMQGLLYGVSTSDPVTFASAAVLLTATALLASWLPARRATRVDPVVALRAE